jgi:hypothetical protein
MHRGKLLCDTALPFKITMRNYFSNCDCILFTRSSSFSDERFSRMLSTFIGKQNGRKSIGKCNE